MSLVIRQAEEADLPSILALYAQPDFDNGKVLPIEEARRLFRRFADYPDYRLFIAEDGDSVVGCYSLITFENLSHLGARSALIESVAVSPDHQRNGVGKAMMDHALAEARARGCYKAALSSNMKREKAHAFYDRLGFERHGYSFLMPLEDA